MTPRDRRTYRAAWAVVPLTGIYVLLAALGFGPADPNVRLVWGWQTPGDLIFLLAVVWSAGPRRLAAAAAGLWVLFVAIGALHGASGGRTAAWGIVDLGIVMAILAAYRRWWGRRRWFPETPGGLLVFAWLSVLGGALAAVGAWWGAGPVVPMEPGVELLVWYAAGWSVEVFLGGIIALAWAHPMRQGQARTRPWLALAALPVGLVSLALIGSNPGLPLTWLALVPALGIGLTLTPRWAAVACCVLGALVRSLPQLFPGWWERHDLYRPAALNVATLFAVLFAMTLVVVRYRQGLLDASVEESRARAAAENTLLEAMIARMTDGVLLAGRDGSILVANPAVRALLGPPVDPVASAPGWVGRYSLLGEGGRPLRGGEIAALEEPGPSPARLPLAVRHGAGLRVLSATVQDLAATRAGEKDAVFVLISDETGARERRRELEAFAGVVAHDLRNPLGAVSLWLDAAELELDQDPQEASECLQRARTASGRMHQVIEDYLAYNVGREGVLRLADVDVADVVCSVAADFAGVRGTTIDVSASARVRGDEALLRQVFANLLGNAVKYARPGVPADIRVGTEPGRAPGWVRIIVADNGIGVADDDAEQMFAPFGRTARGAAAGEGTGLGLALCRDIVTRHGGTITAGPNDRGGTTIALLLPEAGALLRR